MADHLLRKFKMDSCRVRFWLSSKGPSKPSNTLAVNDGAQQPVPDLGA